MPFRLIRLLGLRTLQSRPLRAFLSMLGVMIGVAGILAIGITNQAAMDSITRVFIESSGRSDLVVTSAAGGSGVPAGLEQSLARLPSVARAVPLLQVYTALAGGSQPEALELSFSGISSAGLLLYGIDPGLEPWVRDYRVTAGRSLSTDKSAHEVVLVEDYARDEGIEVGDRISIVTPGGVDRLLVVGLMAREGTAQANSGEFGVMPLGAAQQMFGRRDSYDQMDLVIDTDGAGTLEDRRQTIQERLGSAYSVTYPAGQGERMTQMLSNYQIGLNLLSSIALFVGAFLIYNAFAMSVAERTREFGMLRAVGMTRSQVLLLVISEALIMGVLGSAGGITLGTLGARGLGSLMGQLMGTEIGQRVMPAADTLTLGLAVGIGVTMVAALIPALQAGRISPIAALRISGAAREGWVVRRGWTLGLALMLVSIAILVWNPFPDDPQFRLGSMAVFSLFTGITLLIPVSVALWERATRPIVRRLYGASGTIGSRNLDRSRVRTMLTVGALLIGVSMILVVRTMTASFAGDLTEWVASYMGGDLYVHAGIPLRADLARQIAGVEGVDAATPIHYQAVEHRLADGQWQSITYMAVDPASYLEVTEFVFADSDADRGAAMQALVQGQAILVSSVLAEKYGFARGDTIQLRTRSGPLPFRVAEVVVDFNNQGLVVIGNWNDLRRHFGSNAVSTILVSVDDTATLAQVRARIEALYGKRYQLAVESNEIIRERIAALLDQAFSMFDMMGVLAVMVAALGVVNTLTMNVMERTREIGMLRAVGMTRGQVHLMVLAESALMGVIGGTLGLAFGVLLSRVFMTGMTAMSGYRLTFTVPAGGVVSGLVVSLVVSQIAALMPARRAGKTNVLEALHYE